MGPIDYNVTLVQIMAWSRPGDEPLSEPVAFICVLKVPKFKYDIFGKNAFAVRGPLT